MPVLIEGAVIRVNMRSVTLINVIQALKYFDDLSSVSVRQEVWQLQHL